MKSRNCPQGRSENIVVSVVSGETYVRDLSANKTFHLDKRAAAVWQLCNGTKTVDKIEKILSKQNIEETITKEALLQLAGANLIDKYSPDTKLSRRTALKNFGFVWLAVIFGNLFSSCGGDSDGIRGIIPGGGGTGSFPNVGPGSSGQGAPITGYIFGGPDAGKPTTVLITYVNSKTTSNTPENAANCQTRAQTGCNSKSARLDCFAEAHTCYCVCN